jgi:hypothetical protein
MIPRHQSFLLVILLLASVGMGVMLWQMRERAHQRLLDGEDSAPTQAPAVTPAQEFTLLVANDSDGSMQPQAHTLPLPADPGARARAILGKLLEVYAAPGAVHPVPGGANSITQVFLLPAQPLYTTTPVKPVVENRPAPGGPATHPAVGSSSALPTTAADPGSGVADPSSMQNATPAPEPTTPQLAVVNLTSAFANNHPSGLEAETLTILSLCATLHANLPRVTQVRFLVDGQPRPTLAGHADLTRSYLTSDTAGVSGSQP